jgi:putative PIN family toxin of toxin-antitoxin system
MEAPTVPDVIFDCNFYLRATVSRGGPAADCLRLLEADVYTLFVSRDILEEVTEVLSRPELQQKFPDLTPESVEDLLLLLDEKAILIYNVPETFRYARDPKDEPYINLALVTNAQYLVTYDTDLLDLMDERSEQGRQFRHRFPHLTILDPAAFLQVLRNQEARG